MTLFGTDISTQRILPYLTKLKLLPPKSLSEETLQSIQMDDIIVQRKFMVMLKKTGFPLVMSFYSDY